MAVIYILTTSPSHSIARPGHMPADSPTQAKSWGGIIEFIRQPKVLRIFALIAAFRLLEGFIRAILPTMLKDWEWASSKSGSSRGRCWSRRGRYVLAGGGNFGGRPDSLVIFGGLQSRLCAWLPAAHGQGHCSPTYTIHSAGDRDRPFHLWHDHRGPVFDHDGLERKTRGGTGLYHRTALGVFAMMFGAGLSYSLPRAAAA